MKNLAAGFHKKRALWCLSGLAALALAAPALSQPASPPADPVRVLVKRLDLERYKATIKGLTQFGDRRQGTARNRAAVDWIEAQLKSYGCTNTERLRYEFGPAQERRRRARRSRPRRRSRCARLAAGVRAASAPKPA